MLTSHMYCDMFLLIHTRKLLPSVMKGRGVVTHLGHAGGAAGVDVEDGIVVAGELLCERLGGHGGEDGGEAGHLGRA